jgi:anti-anti-sigma factor
VTAPVQWRRAGPKLEILLSQRGTTTSIELVGECDVAARAGIRDAIPRVLTPDTECVVLDLGRVSFIDASGVGIVVALARRARAQQMRLVICPGPPLVQRVFAMCQLTDALPFLPASPQLQAARLRVSLPTGDPEAGGHPLLPPAGAPVVGLGLATAEPPQPGWFSMRRTSRPSSGRSS